MKRTIYNEEHEAFRDTIRTFIAKEIVPFYEDWQRANRVPREFFNKLGELGVTGFDIPEEYGGAGETSFKFQAIMDEEIGPRRGRFRPLPGQHRDRPALPAAPGERGAEAALATWCRVRRHDAVHRDDRARAPAPTSPGIRTSAKLSEDGTHYILNGAKTFITGAVNSELCVVVARTSAPKDDDRRFGLSLLVVPTDSPGFEYGRRLEKIGQHASDTSELSFTDVRVPVENLLGEEGKGFPYLGQNLPRERLCDRPPRRRLRRRRHRVRQGIHAAAPGVRQAGRLVPEHEVRAGGVRHRGRRSAGVGGQGPSSSTTPASSPPPTPPGSSCSAPRSPAA